MEARIEAVEEELRQEKQKNAALQQKQLEPMSSHFGAGDATRSSKNSFELVNTPPTSGLGEDDTTAGSDDSLNSGSLQVSENCSVIFLLFCVFSPRARGNVVQAGIAVTRQLPQLSDANRSRTTSREVLRRRGRWCTGGPQG